jgi:RimJ/RimL family protein N-acetyltransferase
MKIELKDTKIKLESTIVSDIEKIIDLEYQNRKFVHSYSKEKHLELLNSKDCLHLSIIELKDNSLSGHMIIFGIEGTNDVLELRRLTVSKKGKGFGREAIRLIKKFCFEELNLHRLWLDVYDDNSRAIGLYESEGFFMEGVIRECIKENNRYRSQRIYSILEHEYKRAE